MTQVSVRAITPPPSLTTIPRPREHAGLLSPAVPSIAPHSVAPPAVAPAAPVPPVRRRRHGAGPAITIDVALGFAIAAVATAWLGVLPVEVAFVAAVSWPLLLLASGHYRRTSMHESGGTRARRSLVMGGQACLVALAVSPWIHVYEPIGLAQLLVALGVAAAVHSVLAARPHRLRVVLAGRPRDVSEAALELQDATGHQVVAVCLTSASHTPFGDVPTHVGLQTSADVATRYAADALVVLPGAPLSSVELRRLHWDLAGRGVDLCVGTGLLDVAPTRTNVFSTGGLTLVRALPPSLRGPRRWVKAVVERVSATLGLVVLLPLLLGVGLLVRLDSAGPAIYRQQRVGRDGRLFTMYKFRSMTTSADAERTDLLGHNESDGVLFKIQRDPRITRVGRWLRRTSLDEMPQLWNVVRGEMSLVGPRPALPEEVAQYDVDPQRRLVVKPGMTGLWQVSGRSDLTWDQSVRLDLRYVDNWSLRLDASILARTVSAVLTSRGAY